MKIEVELPDDAVQAAIQNAVKQGHISWRGSRSTGKGIQLMTDTDLLDVLESLPVPTNQAWQVRHSSTGRGWRLLTTSATPGYSTVRAAIEAFARDQAKQGKG